MSRRLRRRKYFILNRFKIIIQCGTAAMKMLNSYKVFNDRGCAEGAFPIVIKFAFIFSPAGTNRSLPE